MSDKNPIIAVTGSSGAGTSTTTNSFSHIFRSLGIDAALVEGDCFHRFSRPEMDVAVRKAKEQGKSLQEHYAHLLIHGALHAQGYDHETSEKDAIEMETLEMFIMASLGLPCPY